MGPGQEAPNPWMIAPFGLLLVLMAAGPILFPAFWSRHYPKVVAVLALAVVGYYLLELRAPGRVWHTARDYFSFIALTGSLFVVSGGIHINVKGEATPLANVAFLLIGALLANVLSGTGAAMLLIRPWLRMNRYRITGYHVVFFIFIICNVGGCLTPVGNPPLFFGYLMGVPFWWVTEHCLPMWAAGTAALLVLFLVLDRRNYLRAPREIREKETESGRWRFDGIGNLFFLGIILAAVFINEPPFLREGLMLAAAAGSWFATGRAIHESNHFDFHPIREVAILFLGIFATMLPALDWLEAHAGSLGNATPGVFYWSSGGLSSILDNAPTYLCFLKALVGRFVDPEVVRQVSGIVQSHGAGAGIVTGAHAEDIRRTLAILREYHSAALERGTLTTDQIEVAFLIGDPGLNRHLVAISVGSVFFGAATYIGNGPNLMVKAIAVHQKVHTPDFAAYLARYTAPFLAPVLAFIWLAFFRH
jgi:Na+/H+ antiporter NhaD/arsenite permease-like protein